MKKKLLIVVSILVCICLIVGTVMIVKNYNENSKLEYKEVYGIVVEKSNDSFRIKDTKTNEEKTYLYDDVKYNKGDLVLIRLKNDKVDDVSLIFETSNAGSGIIVVDDDHTTTTTSVTTTTSNSTGTTTTVAGAPTLNKDEEVLSYVKSFDNEVTTSKDTSVTFKEKVKSGFITLVDFIFYGGTIKGYTFDELKDTTKAKVIYYALIVDGKIDKKFPDYKNTLSEKYKDIKSKLIAKYMDLKYDICEKGPEGCDQASEDLKLLKYSLGLTWDMVKSAFTYVKNLTVPKIQSWYQSFKS